MRGKKAFYPSFALIVFLLLPPCVARELSHVTESFALRALASSQSLKGKSLEVTACAENVKCHNCCVEDVVIRARGYTEG